MLNYNYKTGHFNWIEKIKYMDLASFFVNGKIYWRLKQPRSKLFIEYDKNGF